MASSSGTIHAHVEHDTPCAHCTLPVGSHPIGENPWFCCTGCALVYQSLQSAGLNATYYSLRDLIPEYRASKPARVDVNEIQLAELDTEGFLNEHAKHITEDSYSIELFLDGVHCAACVWLVERLPQEVNGVLKARLDLPRARLYIQFNPEKISLSRIAKWLSQFGYVVHPIRSDKATRRTDAERALLIKAGICWALAGNVMLFAFALYSGLDHSGDTSLLTGSRWASFTLAIISVLYGGSEFFRRAWASLRIAIASRNITHLHIDTPISLGILVGFGHSAWATVRGTGEIWFDSITVLIAALLTARWLQLRSRRIAGNASDRLLSMIPSMARRILSPNTDKTGKKDISSHELVRVDSLLIGDEVEVPAGEVFPVDGHIVKGSTTIDRAVLTGESLPVPVSSGMPVEAGATNIQAPVHVNVAATGNNTRVGKLLAWIRDQESQKAPVLLLADKLSGYFVSGLLLLAVATGVIWLSIDASRAAQHVVALLVISCPCALGMATPLAMAIAAGRAARRGIFIKSDEAMQLLTEVDAIALDKTGTLTEGVLALVHSQGDEEAIQLAASLESHSNHPIAKALVREKGMCYTGPATRAWCVDRIKTVPGHGIMGYVNGKSVAIGRPAWIQTIAAFDEQWNRTLDTYTEAGYTPAAIAVDGQLSAVLAFGDKIREDARAIIDTLQHSGKLVYILSGDHTSVVHRVAEQLGIRLDQAMGDMSPEDKHAFIENLEQKDNRKVAMVGDGVNDAVALQTASIGIAVEGGSSPSLVAANVFMTREGLTPVAEAIRGAHQVLRVIRSNLGISLAYNLLGAGAAILGFITPLVAAIAMPLSSLIVVSSSILQHSFKGSK